MRLNQGCTRKLAHPEVSDPDLESFLDHRKKSTLILEKDKEHSKYKTELENHEKVEAQVTTAPPTAPITTATTEFTLGSVWDLELRNLLLQVVLHWVQVNLLRILARKRALDLALMLRQNLVLVHSISYCSPLVSQQSLTGPQEDGLTQSLKDLEISLEFRLDLKAEDLLPLKEVGAGNGGTVTQVMHVTTKTVMAKKIIHIDVNPTVRKQIQRELQVLHDCNSRYIVSFYGAFPSDSGISMCMKYMDVGF
ncbi:Pkinase-domain-containing protein [Gigaspora margarita]|uniref:Pkinase-domain-containing protein n=1 Tax=Gigaspora margarita TaxID=4874 RepID=A0A8H4A965_GIGMA|nr:Pkinase-domain-containing protein [Gigaspora margarita]